MKAFDLVIDIAVFKMIFNLGPYFNLRDFHPEVVHEKKPRQVCRGFVPLEIPDGLSRKQKFLNHDIAADG